MKNDLLKTWLGLKENELPEQIIMGLGINLWQASGLSPAYYLKKVQKIGYGTIKGHLSEGPEAEVAFVPAGMGSPLTAITVEPLCHTRINTLIGVGYGGALSKDSKPGDLVIVKGAVRNEGTSRNYVPLSYPAYADPQVSMSLLQASRELQYQTSLGVVLTQDVFVTGPTKRLKRWKQRGIVAVDLETAAFLTIAAIHRKKAGVILSISDRPILGRNVFIKDFSRKNSIDNAREGLRKAIKIALRTVIMLKNTHAEEE